jgi:NADP-dependent 3-hydroxy acid dehydrogenase YdfG
MNVQGKVVFITGASSGIGEALAREFARKGCHLVLTARRLDRLEALTKELSALGTKVVCFRADVTQDGDLEVAVREAKLALGRPLDIVVANAGYGVVGTVERLSLEDYRRQFECNVYGVIRTVKATLPDLKETRGTIAVVGSVNGYVALPGNSPYGMSKFAIRAFCDSLAHEMRRYGIGVTHIAPGFIATEIRRVDNHGVWHSGFKDEVPAFIQMSAPVAAKKIARAIIARRRERIVTGHGHFFTFLARHMPWLVHGIIRRLNISARFSPKTTQ